MLWGFQSHSSVTRGQEPIRFEGLCMVLKRLAYPCRYSDLIHRFGRAVPELSMITGAVEEFIYQNHHHRLTQWNTTLLSPRKLQQYADGVAVKGSPLKNCFGFIDGTVRPLSRPGENQKNSVQWAQEAPCPKV